MLNDVLGVGFYARRITVVLKCFSKAQDAEQGIVQFVADACCENTQTSRLLRFHQLLLHAAFVCRVSKDEPDAIGLSRSAGDAKPLVPVQMAAQLQLGLPACDVLRGTSGSLNFIGTVGPFRGRYQDRLPIVVTPQFLTQLLLLRSIHRQRIEQLLQEIVGEPEYIPSRPIDVLHLFLVVHDQNGSWHGIQNLIGGSLQVLDFLRLQVDLIGQTCEGRLQLPVHAVELFRQCLQLIAGLDLNGLPQLPASNRLRGLLQLANRRDDSLGREIAQCCQQCHGDGAKHRHPCE